MICVLCFILDKCRLVSTCSTRRVFRYLFAASRMCHHSSGSSTFQLRQHVNRKIPIYGKSPLPSPPNVSVRFAENQECAGMLRYLTWKLSDCFPCGAHKEHNILILILKMNIWHIYIYKYPEEWKYDETNCWSWILTISTKTICWNCNSSIPEFLQDWMSVNPTFQNSDVFLVLFFLWLIPLQKYLIFLISTGKVPKWNIL